MTVYINPDEVTPEQEAALKAAGLTVAPFHVDSTRYKTAHAQQQRRIRELVDLLAEAQEMIYTLSDAWADNGDADKLRKRMRSAILKGAK